MVRSSTITYGPFEGRSRHLLLVPGFALLATLLLGVAVSATESETLQCTRPPGGVLSCEILTASPLFPVQHRRVNTDCGLDTLSRDVIPSKGSDVTEGKTVIVDACGRETDFGTTTVAQAQLNTEQFRQFLKSSDSSALRIDVPPSYGWALWLALWGCLFCCLTTTLVARGCRDLGVYRVQVRPPPDKRSEVNAAGDRPDTYRGAARHVEVEGPCLRVTWTILGVPVRVREVAIPLDVVEVEIERGTVPILLLQKYETPPKGGRLVLRTAAGAVLPVIPELRRGEEVHDRARVALARALGIEGSGGG